MRILHSRRGESLVVVVVSIFLVLLCFGPEHVLADYDFTFDELYELCLSDSECRDLFNMNPHGNKNIFKKILWNVFNNDEFAEELDDPDIEVPLMKLKLLGYKHAIRCPANHHYVMDDEGKGRCECMLDRSCNECAETEPVLVAAVVLGLVFLLILLFNSCCCLDRNPPLPDELKHTSSSVSSATPATQPNITTSASRPPIPRHTYTYQYPTSSTTPSKWTNKSQ
jgi:hypothetical protein